MVSARGRPGRGWCGRLRASNRALRRRGTGRRGARRRRRADPLRFRRALGRRARLGLGRLLPGDRRRGWLELGDDRVRGKLNRSGELAAAHVGALQADRHRLRLITGQRERHRQVVARRNRHGAGRPAARSRRCPGIGPRRIGFEFQRISGAASQRHSRKPIARRQRAASRNRQAACDDDGNATHMSRRRHTLRQRPPPVKPYERGQRAGNRRHSLSLGRN
jgi:hypothetical protein